MFREPITTSMEYGWCLRDPELIKQTWYKTDERHPQPMSERTRYINIFLEFIRQSFIHDFIIYFSFLNSALLVNKHFTL